MKELKFPEIKLFGKKIALPENERFEAGEKSSRVIGNEDGSGSDSDCCLNPMKVRRVEENEAEDDEDVNMQEADKIRKRKSIKEGNNLMIEESQNPRDLSDFDNRPDTPSLDEDSAGKQSPDSENDQSDTNNSPQAKNLKKPDKILPCPRCKSMETKFCYYNNYNVNQPRHFCKSCQRYWTAGGMMRNVPVGAGRRKNKNSVSSHCHHINISEADGFHHPSIKPDGTVLSFGPELPLNEKNATNSNDFAQNSCISNQVAHQGGKNGYQEIVWKNINSFPAPVPYYPNVNCPFPNPVPIPVPGICPPGFPMPFYPAPIWNCGIPGSWSFPWLPPVFPSMSVNLSRDFESLKPKNLEGSETNDPVESSILVPKTLRIGDPDEAAMSSIWTTLGIKSDSTSRVGLFKAFQPKNEEKRHSAATSPLLQANPAALSRSVNFQETA